MAANLLRRGWSVHVRDVDRACESRWAAQGATVHPTPAAMAGQCPVVIVSVVDAVQTREVVLGENGLVHAGAAGPAGALTVVLCPTIAPADVAEIAQALARHGVDCIDAPMSGGPARASDGTMSLMVACPEAVFARHESLLRDLSSRLFRVGPRLGDGARTKLVNNLLAGINLVGAAEAMVLAQRLGLDLERTLEVISQSSGQSWIGSDRMARAIAGDFEPRAHMTLLAKDTALAMHAAQSCGYAGPLGEAASRAFAQAVKDGLADRDDAALFKHLGGTAP